MDMRILNLLPSELIAMHAKQLNGGPACCTTTVQLAPLRNREPGCKGDDGSRSDMSYGVPPDGSFSTELRGNGYSSLFSTRNR